MALDARMVWDVTPEAEAIIERISERMRREQMKVFVDEDEWWPVYSLHDCTATCEPWCAFEMAAEDRERIRQVFKAFDAVQTELRSWHEKGCDKPAT